MMADRTPQEIRASIEQNRQQLGGSLVKLRVEVARMTDWRGQLRRHRTPVLIAAGVAGFVLGGGLAALTGFASGGGRNKRGALERG